MTRSLSLRSSKQRSCNSAAPSTRCRSGVVLADPDRRDRVDNRRGRARYHGHAAVLVEKPSSGTCAEPSWPRQRADRRVHRAAAHGAGHPCDPARGWRRARHDRRRQRAGAARRRAHRLRRQHQPRAEDPGRRARRCWPRRWPTRTTRRSSAGWPSRMIDEAHRVARMIDDLLELSRIELGGQRARARRRRARRRRGRRRVRRPPPSSAAIKVAVDDATAISRRRRPSAAGVGGRQPARERRQVLRRRLAASSRRSRTRRRHGSRSIVADHGIGIPARDHRPHLRALLPRRPGPQPRHRRHRARPVDRAPCGHEPRRRGHGRVPRGRGLHVHAPVPDSRPRHSRGDQ